MNAAGIIFADAFDVELDELLGKRTMAAVPFGARYRVIDFVLSGMVNADIRNIGVITTLKYGSLMGHIRSGEVWDLNRKNSALTVLPPFSGHEADRMHDSRMEALHGNMPYLRHIHEKYILLSGSNYIANMNFSAMLEQHVRSGAVVTAVCTRQPVTMSPDVMRTQYRLGDDGHVLRLKQKKGLEDGAFAATNTYIMERKTLMQYLEDATATGQTGFREDVLQPLIRQGKVMAYEASEPILFLDNISAYLESNLALLDDELRDTLFHNSDRPVLTRVKDSSPGRYEETVDATNSLIAAGTTIEGTVRNSVIFRGVKIGAGAVVENSVIMQESEVAPGAHLAYAVVDKSAVIHEGRTLSGYITHPFVVGNKTEI